MMDVSMQQTTAVFVATAIIPVVCFVVAFGFGVIHDRIIKRFNKMHSNKDDRPCCVAASVFAAGICGLCIVGLISMIMCVKIGWLIVAPLFS